MGEINEESRNILVFIRATYNADVDYLLNKLRRRRFELFLNDSLIPDIRYPGMLNYYDLMNTLFYELAKYDQKGQNNKIIIFFDPGLVIRHETRGYYRGKEEFYANKLYNPDEKEDPLDYISDKIENMPFEGIISSDIIRYPRYNQRRWIKYLNDEVEEISNDIIQFITDISNREADARFRRYQEEIREKEELERKRLRLN